MSATAHTLPHVTIEDWLAQPPERRFELIDGSLVEKAAPDVTHADSQGAVIGTLRPTFHRRPGGGGPGGWWILPEVDIRLGANGFRPDVAGWRRERVPVMPTERPVTLRPDWICEVLSASNSGTDTIRKMRRYHQAGVPHYWIVDPATQTLAVYRNDPDGFTQIRVAEKHERVRAEPFDAIELRVGVLFGDDPDD